MHPLPPPPPPSPSPIPPSTPSVPCVQPGHCNECSLFLHLYLLGTTDSDLLMLWYILQVNGYVLEISYKLLVHIFVFFVFEFS